jgi:hypothetical protein
MTQNHSAKLLLATSALLVTVFSAAAIADTGERGKQEEIISTKVEVTGDAQTATDVVLTEHPGVTQVEPGRSIDDDTRLKPAE